MSEPVALVVDAPIDRAWLEAQVVTEHDGAVVVFEGVIRDHDHGASVTALDYQAHPDAERFLAHRADVTDVTSAQTATVSV